MPGPWEKLTRQIVDTHCHVHHYSKPIEAAIEIDRLGIKTHCVTVKPPEFDECSKQFQDFSGIIPCIGLFPLNVKEEQNNLDIFFKHLENTRFVGEIGLDYSITDQDELGLQKEIFRSILDACDQLGNKILSIHSRRSAEDVLAFIGDDFNGTAIMHWFSGPEELIKKSPTNVFYSVNSAMLKSRQGKQVLKALRPEQVLTETDGPYVKINGKPAVPADIRNVINTLSSLWNKSIEESLDIITANYSRASH